MEREVSNTLWESYRSNQDPTAFDRLFDALLPGILRRLQTKFPTTPWSDLEDSASEAFLFLAVKPETFDPAQAALSTFLYIVARNKLIDKIRVEQRYNAVPLDELQYEPLSAICYTSNENSVENEAIAFVVFGVRHTRDDLRPDVQDWLQKVLPNPRDRDLFLLSADGRLTVEAFATLYDMAAFPLDEQRRAMKRNRDRIQKRVERDSEALRQLLQDTLLPDQVSHPKARQEKIP